jgi:polycystin 1L2
MLIIVYFMIVEIRSFLYLKRAYFHRPWSYIELGIIGCSWASLGAYVQRYREVIRIGALFQNTNGFSYVNLQQAAYVNDAFTVFLGLCCFFGSMKFLRLCRFNQRLSLLINTLRHAAKDLLCFMLMFSFIFMAFLVLFHLLFASKIWACSSLLQTSQILIEMILLKFDVTELREADAVLGPLCFSLFILFVVFICMDMFISIINGSFRTVRHNLQLSLNEDHHMFAFMLNKFLRWTGYTYLISFFLSLLMQMICF